MEHSGCGQSSVKEKQRERMKRLQELHIKRNEACQINHQAVIEEHRRNKLPPNWESRKRKAEWILNDEEKRREAEKKGEDYDRIKLLNIEANEAKRLHRKKKKKNPDIGFADYAQATARQYHRLVKSIKPDMEQYEYQKQKLGEAAFYGGKNAILFGLHKDTKEGIDRMVQDLEKQIAKREKYSRRRMYNDDIDRDFINERNMKFNKKLERFYGQYSREIKQSLERGTAV